MMKRLLLWKCLLLVLLVGCKPGSIITINVQPKLLKGAVAHYRTDRGVLLNDLKVTPGVVNPAHDTSVICHSSTRPWRHTTQAMKDSVYRFYGIPSHKPGQYEVDHLIPLEDGGADAVKNLWPQPANPTPGFHEKDLVENWVHAEVCAGRLDLAAAQKQLMQDWYVLYLRMQGSMTLEDNTEEDP